MSAMKTMILCGGGMRSLVATALVLAEPRKQVISLLHLVRAGEHAARRLSFARRQARHFQTCRLVELAEPDLAPSQDPARFDTLLESILEHAAEAHIDRLIWPAQFDGDFARLAAMTEHVMLLRHRLLARGLNVPRIETPLAELTDIQLGELGAVMNVPWELAWSCAGVGEQPCRECAGCRRRAAVFAAMLLDDPLLSQGSMRRQPAR